MKVAFAWGNHLSCGYHYVKKYANHHYYNNKDLIKTRWVDGTPTTEVTPVTIW